MGIFSKPTWGVLDWANVSNYPGGTGHPWQGQPTKAAPATPYFEGNRPIPPEHVNYLLHELSISLASAKAYEQQFFDWSRLGNVVRWTVQPLFDGALGGATIKVRNATWGSRIVSGNVHDEGMWTALSDGRLAFSSGPGFWHALPTYAGSPLSEAMVCGAVGSNVFVGGFDGGFLSQSQPVRTWDLSTGAWLGAPHSFGASRYPTFFMNMPTRTNGILVLTSQAPANAVSAPNFARFGSHFTTNASNAAFIHVGDGNAWGSAKTTPAAFNAILTATANGSRGKIRGASNADASIVMLMASLTTGSTALANSNRSLIKSTDQGNTWATTSLPDPYPTDACVWSGPTWTPDLGFVVTVCREVNAYPSYRHITKVYSSPDGTTWTELAHLDPGGTTNPSQNVAIDDLSATSQGVLVASVRGLSSLIASGTYTGQTYGIRASLDGVTWHACTGFGGGQLYSGSGHALAGGVAPRMLLVGGGEWAESQPVIGNTSAITYP